MKSNNSAGIIVLIIVIIGVAFYVLGRSNPDQLSRSPIGNLGIKVALEDVDIEVTPANYRVLRDPGEFGAQIIPIFDGNIQSYNSNSYDVDRNAPNSFQDIYLEDYEFKLDQLPSLVILPKWQTDTLRTGVANRQNAIPVLVYNRLLNQLGLTSATMDRLDDRFFEFEWEEINLALFAPQFFERRTIPDFCVEDYGLDAGALILKCDLPDFANEVHFVSDPDLFNNHGLAIAQNSEFARQFLLNYVSGYEPQAIFLDNIADVTLYDDEYAEQREDYDRNDDDLMRYFQYPLSVFWGLIAVVLCVFLWRGGARFGPVQEKKNFDIDVSSAAASGAMARILRMTGNDASIISEFVKTRIELLAARTFGEQGGENLRRNYFEYLKRQGHPDADAFEKQSLALINANPSTKSTEMYRGLENLRNLTRKVVGSDEFE